jgi:hypothetical protein
MRAMADMFEPHLLQVHLQLFGDQHRDRGIGPLTHLDIRHREDDMPVSVNADEGVWRESIGICGFGFAASDRQCQAQHQAVARRRSRPYERAPRETMR